MSHAVAEPTRVSPTPLSPAKSIRKLTVLSLVAATFFMVSGGPFGLEELVSNAGYLRSIIVLLVVPVIWSFPTSLMVSELSSSIPVDGGYYVWVTRGLGPFWGFQEAWLSLAASIFDLALYPTVFVLYASRIFPVLQDKTAAWAAGAALVIICSLWNLRGARVVGNSAVLLGLLLLAPFAFLSAKIFVSPTLWNSNPSAATEGTLLTGILVGMWNFMGWDNASTVAGEVHNPQKTYSRAMFLATMLVAVSYLIPVAACWRAGIDPSSWTTGAWAEVALHIGGRGLFLAVVIGGIIFGVGMFNSLSMSYTRVPYAMATDGWLPQSFTKVNRFGVPWLSVLVCAVAWVIALSLGFVALIELDVAIYGLSLILEFAALIALRIKQPDMHRPFRVPGGLLGCFLAAAGPTALIILAVIDSFHQQSTLWGFTFNNLAFSGVVVIWGVVQYFIANRRRALNVAALESAATD